MKDGANDPCPCGSNLNYRKCCQDEGNASVPNNPDELLEVRFQALQNEDYERLYASYHPQSPFLQQFSDRATYVRFARHQLSDIKLVNWFKLGRRRLAADRVEQLLVMEIAVAEGRQFLYELALLVRTGAGWRYHSAQKLSGEDYRGAPDQLDFHHFDDAVQKIRY